MIPNINPKIQAAREAATLENVIEGLDQRGLLVFQILIGQQAMKLLSEKHIKDVTKPDVLKPE